MGAPGPSLLGTGEEYSKDRLVSYQDRSPANIYIFCFPSTDRGLLSSSPDRS
jgi:hypothetical protein